MNSSVAHSETIISPILSVGNIDDIRLAARRLKGMQRRLFQAEMTLKYCQGSARKAEEVFGWGRNNIETGFGEKRTGIRCIGSQSGFSGNLRWEERYPEIAQTLVELAEAHAQQNPSFNTSVAYTRLTGVEALRQLREKGVDETSLPSKNAMMNILNRLGYRLRPVIKARPQKKFKKRMTSSQMFMNETNRQKQKEPNASVSIAKPQ